jgi:transcriptional regulator with XRE-family HTH domain
LGEWLRQRREELGISLEQAETSTRIRRQYLEALESEKFEGLPDTVVGRGFLRNYASYLGLDPKEATDRFARVAAPPEPESLSVEGPTPFTSGPFRPVALHDIKSRPSRWVWIVGLIVLVVVALAALAWWEYPRLSAWVASLGTDASPTDVPPTPLATKAALATATYTPAATPVPTWTRTAAGTSPISTLDLTQSPALTLSPSPTPSPPVYTGIFLELVFTDTSWIQVAVDGVREFQGELEAGTYRSWYGEERIELRVGNAGAVLVTLNGQALGTLGAAGEVVDRVFEKVGAEVVAATVTPVPTLEQTLTPTVKPTARPSATQPTPTVAPSVTVKPTAQINPTTSP